MPLLFNRRGEPVQPLPFASNVTAVTSLFAHPVDLHVDILQSDQLITQDQVEITSLKDLYFLQSAEWSDTDAQMLWKKPSAKLEIE